MHALLLLSAISIRAQTRRLPSRVSQTPPAGRAQAAAVTIVRDDWGIAHVHGKTDADAVFGMIYAQAEDDFNRVETNYLNAMGRLAEAEGESAIWQDLRMKLFIDPDSMRAQVRREPRLAQAADGRLGRRAQLLPRTPIPQVKPRVITRFEPWMALTFSEGSIGGDIESVDLDQLEAFYGDSAGRPRRRRTSATASSTEPTGSNGFAIAPANTVERPRAAADQSAHLVLLPLRAADDERRGAQRLRRGDLGPVLHLPGLQRPARLDAHLDRRRRGRRVRRDRRAEGRPAVLPVRRARSGRS